jgi:hypothetical protein
VPSNGCPGTATVAVANRLKVEAGPLNKHMPKQGNNYKFNEKRRAAFLEHIRKGLSRRQACAAVDIDQSTLWYFIESHPDFVGDIERAEVDACDAVEEMFKELMPKEWQAMKWWLQKRSKDRWGDTKPTEAPPAPTDPKNLAEELKRLLNDKQNEGDCS